jgi:hypothetical protein
MKLPFPILLSSACAAGAAVAWLGFPPTRSASPPAASAGPGVAVLTESAAGAAAVKSTLISSWEAIQSSNLQGMDRRLALATLVGRATSREMPRLLDLTKKDSFARQMLLRRWVELDPQAAGNWLGPGMRGFTFIQSATTQDIALVFGAWAQKDPEAAVANLKSNIDPLFFGMFQEQVLDFLIALDMEAGIRLAALKKGTEQSLVSWSNNRDSEWVNQDPAKAARLLATLPSDSFRDSSLMKVMAVLAKTDLAAAIALQHKFPDLKTADIHGNDGGNDEQRAVLYQEWAKSDLAGMTAFLNDKAGPETRTAMREAIAKQLGETDPNTALTWAADHLTGDRRHAAVEQILTKLTKDDPAGALRYLDSLPEGSALANAVDTFASAGKEGDYAALLAHADGLPDGPARQQLAGKAYEAWFGKEPEVLLKTLAKRSPDSLPQGLWGDLANRTNNMEDALKHLALIPESGSAEYVKNVFGRHSGWNPNFADIAKSINRLQVPAQRLAALESVGTQSAWINPQGLVEYGRTLTSQAERQLIVDRIRKDNRSLTDPEKERLVAPLKSGAPP